MKKVIWVLVLIMIVGVVTMRVIENNTSPKLGVTNGLLSPLSSRPNCVSSQTDVESKFVAPISYTGAEKEQMQQVIRAIESMDGAVIKQRDEQYLYAVFTSSLMRFKDDVEVYLDDESKLLHFRSASRVGYSDLGVNRKRYEAFARAVDGK